MNWVNLDVDFGAPWQEYQVSLRYLYHCDALLVESLKKSPVELANYLQLYVEQIRPELIGCNVIAMNLRGGLQLSLTVVHPNLPLIPMGGKPEPLSLYPCAKCRKDLLVDGMQYIECNDRLICKECLP